MRAALDGTGEEGLADLFSDSEAEEGEVAETADEPVLVVEGRP